MARDGEVGKDQVGDFPGCYLWGGGRGSDRSPVRVVQMSTNESPEEPAWGVSCDQP